jgi:predicted phage tail protein
LKWDKPEDDGGKPVTGYLVEKLDTSTGRWVPVGRTTEPEMDVKGLQEGNEYKFRVKAVNDEGESESLETERATIAKNPFGKLKTLFIYIYILKYTIYSETCMRRNRMGPNIFSTLDKFPHYTK